LAAFQYRFELDIFSKVFGYKVPYIAGGISGTESSAILQRWNAGQIPLLLCHPASVGHGLNLQAAGHTLVWVGLPWDLEHFQQTVKRLHRQGQQNAVTVHIIAFRNTVDGRVAKVLADKDVTQQDLLDALKEEFR
jgi:SNF2 family DNA or RNA helicase